MSKSLLFPILSVACLYLSGSGAIVQASDPDLHFFESKVRPLLAEHCYQCHGPDQQEAGLRLDTYAGVLAGGVSGPTLLPGDAEHSLMLSAISFRDEALQMPPDGKLGEEQIAVLKQWIEIGAPHPDQGDSVAALPRPGGIDLEEARKFWAFQPVGRPETPALESHWVNNPIDAFILAELNARGLKATVQADKRTLIRRATFDLIGLPPTAEEIAAFLADESPGAFARVVDRLLSSEHYGERWGRHWLDVARYADSNGLDENVAHGNAWRYRDYVVKAFNDDQPFDQFVMQQIAGDLLAAQPSAGDLQDTIATDPLARSAERASQHLEGLIATGFLVLGPKVLAEGDQEKLQMDIIDEQIDTLGRAFLGMTLGCARCHDHKFDPIAMDDYYGLAGIFKSTQTMESLSRIAKWNENVIATAEQVEAKRVHEEQIAEQKTAIEAILATTSVPGTEPAEKANEGLLSVELRDRLRQHRESLAHLEQQSQVLPTAMGVREGEVIDCRVHVRGSHLTLGKQVPRSLPAVIATQQPYAIDAQQSGRLQLARWLVGGDNPLTPRVIVNRLWRWHFGKGLVASTDNFGALGQRPRNQPLLDWLAAEFRDSGWSIKSMHRLIMLSNTYQLSSRGDAHSAAIDPDNHYHRRAEVRRLEAEAVRDAVLAVSGLLDATMQGSLLHVENRAFLFDHTSKDTTSYASHRRSIYLPVIRNNLYDGFSLFDYTTADVPNGDRETSTVATQALFLMNSDLLLESSSAVAQRVLAQRGEDNQARAEHLYELALGRNPTAAETQRLLEAVERLETLLGDDAGAANDRRHAAWTAACQAILASNEFLYVR